MEETESLLPSQQNCAAVEVMSPTGEAHQLICQGLHDENEVFYTGSLEMPQPTAQRYILQGH